MSQESDDASLAQEGASGHRDQMDELQWQAGEAGRSPGGPMLNRGVLGSNCATRSYIYLPRERHIPPFTGEFVKDGRSVDEFIEEVERVLRAREQSPAEQLDYVFSLLRGPALDEVRLCRGHEARRPSDLFRFLQEAFGEKRSATQLLQAFYLRGQAEGESLRDFSHALSQLLNSFMKVSPGALADEHAVLRDQFVEGLRDTSLKRELRKFVRDKPHCTVLDVRNEGILWTMEDGKSCGSRVIKNRHIQSEATCETPCYAVGAQDKSATLEDVLRAVAQQDKRLTEQDRAISELTQAVRGLTAQPTGETGQSPHKMKMRPRFTDDGQPICFRCNGAGHIASKCPQKRVDRNIAPTQSQKVQGN